MNKTLIPLAAFISVLSGTACDTDEPPELTETKTLNLRVDGLEDLGDDYVYEGWVILDGAPVSTGRFAIADVDTMRFEMDAADADQVTAFVLSIEPTVGDDPGPSQTKILGGDFDVDEADLVVAHAAALGTDFSVATGSYILETPSTASVAEDYSQGVWFVDAHNGLPSLDLPTLPEGWVYEGWVVDSEGPISTGQFSMSEGADEDGAGETAGEDGAPPFPGQDFILPPMDLLMGAVVISVEPVPDNSAAPFAIKPLIDHDVEDHGAAVLQEMELQDVGALHTGLAWFE